MTVRVSPESVSHHGYAFGPSLGLVSAGEKLHDRGGDDRDRDFHLNRVGDEPVHFPGVLHVRRHWAVLQASCRVLFQSLLHQIDEPGADYATIPPATEDIICIYFLVMETAEQVHSFADGLHHAELYTIATK